MVKVLWILVRQNKILNLLNIITMGLFFTLILVLIINFNQANLETTSNNHFLEKNLYKLSDDLIGEKEAEFFSSLKNYDLLNEFVNTTMSDSGYTYYNSIWQPIGIADFKGDQVFEAYYEMGDTMDPYEYNGKTYINVKSIQLNNPVFDLNNIQLSSGKYFSEEDYKFYNGMKKIPIILGAEYSTIYELGDEVEINYFEKSFKGEVKGILNYSQKIMTSNEPEVLLDRYIIIPTFNFDETPSSILSEQPKNELFVRASLLNNANGMLVTELSPLEIRKVFDNISSDTGFENYQILGANSIAVDSLVKMTETNRIIIFSGLAIVFVISLITFLFTLSLKMNKNIGVYSVLIISGSSPSQILKYIKHEIVLTSIFSILLPVIPLFLILNDPSGILLIYLLISTLIILIIIYVIEKYIKRIFNTMDIIQELKG
jgi:hypothetical protein